MELPGTQDAAIDANGNPGMEITGCPNCGQVPAQFRGIRYLSIIGHAALRNGGQQHPNDPCSRACRLQWEYAEHVQEGADALERLHERQKHHALRGARRRLLLDLSNAPKGALGKDKLAAAASTWGRDAGELVDVDMQVSGARFDAALEQLVQAEHVKAAKDRYTITAAGRKGLKVIVEPSPVIDDIDAGADPATDPPPPAGDPDVMLPKGTRAEVALAIVMQRPGITIPEISEQMGIQQNYLYRILPGLQDDGLIRKDGRGWYPAPDAGASVGGEAPHGDEVVIVHVTPTHGGSPVEAELQPDPPKGATGSRKVIYVASRTAAWVAADRISTPPVAAIA